MERIHPIIYFFLALGCFLGSVGIIIWMIGYFRKDQAESPQIEEGELPSPGTARAPVAPPTAEAAPEAPHPPPLPAADASVLQPGEQELLRVLRTPSSQAIILVRGQRYNSLREIKDALAERDAAEALHAILKFAEGWLPALRHAPSAPPVVDKQAMEDAFLKQLRQSDLFQPESSRGESLWSAGGSVIAAMDKSIRSMVSSPPGNVLVAPAEQINALVQQRLQDHPEMRKYGIIRLSTSKEGDLKFHVGLHTYDSPESIPEPDVREIIQDAIREWRGD